MSVHYFLSLKHNKLLKLIKTELCSGIQRDQKVVFCLETPRACYQFLNNDLFKNNYLFQEISWLLLFLQCIYLWNTCVHNVVTDRKKRQVSYPRSIITPCSQVVSVLVEHRPLQTGGQLIGGLFTDRVSIWTLHSLTESSYWNGNYSIKIQLFSVIWINVSQYQISQATRWYSGYSPSWCAFLCVLFLMLV